MPTLTLIDGSGFIFRAYHALPHLSTSKGEPTNAVYGFTTMLLKGIREGNPTHFAVAFDEEAKAKRMEVYPEYKATREKLAAAKRTSLILPQGSTVFVRSPRLTQPQGRTGGRRRP